MGRTPPALLVPRVVSPEPVVARNAVGPDLLERVAEVRVAVGVVDGGGEIEPGHAER